jgi:phage-related protein
MPAIGPRCHELRITDRGRIFRIFYRTDTDAIVIMHALAKKTASTPARVIEQCKRRLKEFDRA